MNPVEPHRLFNIQDIVDEIIGHLVVSNTGDDNPDYPTPPSRSDLLSAALSCRAFSEPCLDLLWRHLPSIWPVIYLLPLSFPATDKEPCHLLEKVTTEDWDHIRSYLNRVQSLFFRHDKELHRSVFSCIFTLLQDQPFLPSLRRLHWEFHNSGTSESLIFISPSLRRVRVRWRVMHPPNNPNGTRPKRPIDHLGVFLVALAEYSPQLSELKFDDEVRPGVSSLIARFRQLTSLNLSCDGFKFTPEMFRSISHFPNLTTLDIRTEGLATTFGLGVGSFQALESLTLGGKIPRIVDLLPSFSSSPLVRLAIYCVDQDCKFVFCRPLFTMVARFFASSLLRLSAFFPISRPQSYDEDNQETFHLMTFLDPILSIKQIHSIVIRFPTSGAYLPLSLSDDDVGRMATSWPNIRKLHLRLLRSESDIAPTLQTLSTLAKQCPSLFDLSLCINATNSHSYLEDLTPLRTLRYLDLSGSDTTWDVAADVARVVHFLFPDLIEFVAWARKGIMVGPWNRVLDEARLLRQV
ncbi:hypothetical protein JAAARDRAFT_41254 [Jaapia argillacea MUCL 33604]|uniref:F-box domain-containing protein n=1 Tax=Jaapia argillacea MUCL 33604 TaxID=933084 RepID=A0A067P8F9_9AGAM|nr:hypothetical protein JAAARDRAFT_41254 [Jaapia argillacea MUCL 33604]